MSASLQPEFLNAINTFRTALDSFSNNNEGHSTQQKIITVIMTHMLEEAYIRITNILGTSAQMPAPLSSARKNDNASVIKLDGKQLQTIMIGLIKSGDPGKTLELIDDGIILQAVLLLDKDQSKQIYQSASNKGI